MKMSVGKEGALGGIEEGGDRGVELEDGRMGV